LATSFESADVWPECAKIINDIRDQSNCGCCWAFAASETASDRLCIATKGKTMVPLSAQDMCFCSEANGCDGGMLNTAWNYLRNDGLLTGGQYNGTGPFGKGLCADFSISPCDSQASCGNVVKESPQCPTSCATNTKAQYSNFQEDRFGFSGKVDLLSNEEMIMKSMTLNGPVETAFTVYKDFPNYSSGVYQQTSKVALGGHAVKIVGWGEQMINGTNTKYWRIANSWADTWGEDGFFKIIRGVDECGIESQAMASAPGSTWGKMSSL